ncbi:MAG: type II secretion system protein J [Opitutales bacterium]
MLTRTLNYNKRRKRGFTLVELMTATGIMVALMSMVFVVTELTLTAWNNAAGKLSTNAEARSAFDKLSSDLESAIFRKDGRVWMEIAFDLADGVANIDLPPPPQFMFYAPIDDRGDPYPPGSVSAVKYSMQHRSLFDESIFDIDAATDGNSRVYGLFRAQIDARATFRGPLNASSDIISPGDYWNRTSLGADLQFIILDLETGSFGTDGDVEGYSRSFSNYLAGNIVDLRVTLGGLDPDTDYADGVSGNLGQFKLTREAIESLSGYSEISPQVSLKFSDQVWTGDEDSPSVLAEELPAYVDVSMTVITPEGASAIKTLADATTGEIDSVEFQEIAVKNGSTFTRRIFLSTSDI